MRKSIAYLPPNNQNDLNYIVESVLKRIKQTKMIILFGSYARNDYVVYDEKFEAANEFLHTAKLIYKEQYYKRTSFQLHQACENYFYAIRLVYTQQNSKQHNLAKLFSSVKKYSTDFAEVFPQDTPEEKRLFELIKAAYVNGRYDPDFVVTKEDIDALVPKVELLREITERICKAKIEEYGIN